MVKYKAFNTSFLAAVIPDTEWCQMLRKVVEPIREEIFQAHKMEKSDLNLESLSLQCKKLGFLITYLCHGKPDANYLPLNLDATCQQIVFNTNKQTNKQSFSIQSTIVEIKNHLSLQ